MHIKQGYRNRDKQTDRQTDRQRGRHAGNMFTDRSRADDGHNEHYNFNEQDRPQQRQVLTQSTISPTHVVAKQVILV